VTSFPDKSNSFVLLQVSVNLKSFSIKTINWWQLSCLSSGVFINLMTFSKQPARSFYSLTRPPSQFVFETPGMFHLHLKPILTQHSLQIRSTKPKIFYFRFVCLIYKVYETAKTNQYWLLNTPNENFEFEQKSNFFLKGDFEFSWQADDLIPLLFFKILLTFF
jgi:hypothetical protein